MLRVEREDGELLVLDGLALASAFIAGDVSARPGGYDSLAGTGDADRITPEDVRTVNQTMRARSGLKFWQPILDEEHQWLAAIPSDLDLIGSDDSVWEAANGADLVSVAIARCIRPHIALARATKVLHLKRPRLFPVLDELVVSVMGINMPDAPTREQRIDIARRVTSAIRREGRRNLEPLLRIQSELASRGRGLSLVRLLDIALWSAHPAAGITGAKRELTVRVRPCEAPSRRAKPS